MAQVDIIVQDHGTVVQFLPLTDAGWDWLETNCEYSSNFGRSLIVDHRCAPAIIEGLADSDLVIN